MHVDWLIVGAGLTGAVLAERLATQCGLQVLVIDRRGHIGGNSYDEIDAAGVLMHRYGPHIFHTSQAHVWEYLSRFTTWRDYTHRVLTVVDGQALPLPVNLFTLRALYPTRRAEDIAARLTGTYGVGAWVTLAQLQEHPTPAVRAFAREIYRRCYRGYTLKQWGRPAEELDPSVLARVPIHLSEANQFFRDTHQGIPTEGYTALFERLLAHGNITIRLKTDYQALEPDIRYDHLLYTGSIDDYFGYRFGTLPYRSVRFACETVAQEWFQEVAQVNYPGDEPFTRITESKHLTGQRLPVSTITREYPEAYAPGRNEPYYPIPCAASRDLYARYQEEAQRQGHRVHFAGRLGDYQYYNMDQAVARALALFEEICGQRPHLHEHEREDVYASPGPRYPAGSRNAHPMPNGSSKGR